MKVFCVIPAWNEEKNIAKVIQQVKPLVTEVILVDDCSNDNTIKIAKKEGITVLRHIINRDQGAALKTGTEYAIKKEADIIVHFDADGQMRAEDIAIMIKPIIEGEADVVFGSRFLNNTTQMPFFKKTVIMPLARLVNRLLFGVNLTDPQSGFRAMSLKASKKIKWFHDGKAHCSEILALVSKSKLKVKEVPITIIYNEFGQKFSGGIRILKDLFLAKLIN